MGATGHYDCIPATQTPCEQDACADAIAIPCDAQTGLTGIPTDCRTLDPSFVCTKGAKGLRCEMPVALRECEPGETFYSTFTCEGAIAKVCVAGKWAKMDCSLFGAVCNSEEKRCTPQ